MTATVLFLMFIWIMYEQVKIAQGNWTSQELSNLATTIGAFGGVLLLVVTYLALRETIRQRERYEAPAVIVRLIPGHKNPNLLHFSVKNTGGGPAYDISIKFLPNLPYRENTSLNTLNMFQNMPLLEQGEEISFYYMHAAELYNTSHPKKVDVTVTYYNAPKQNQRSKKFMNNYNIDFEERRGQMSLEVKDMNDLVKEIEELKYALLLTHYEKERKND